ncbi:hypothetical protein PMAYCL1PPCAC_21045, partial [Pristionchus mayeri]
LIFRPLLHAPRPLMMGSIFRRNKNKEEMRSGRRDDSRQPPPPAGFYYSSSSSRAAPSPSIPLSSRGGGLYTTHNGLEMMPQPHPTPRGRDVRGEFTPADEGTPSYHVEHLATFAIGRQHSLMNPGDGIRKLQEMERRSAIWAQPMILRLRHNVVSVEDENGALVESFPMELVEQPTAHIMNDPREQYNNILLFVVVEDSRNKRSTNPTEIHIFQCTDVSATEVAEDLRSYIRGQFQKVQPGRRTGSRGQSHQPAYAHQHGGGGHMYADNASVHSEGSDTFEIEVNTLNRCFDDIERFVSRIQAAGIAQRQIEEQRKYRTANRKGSKGSAVPPPDPHGIQFMRSRLPNEAEFVEIFRKFKLCFNLLAKLKNHIHEPNAPELLHFLFSPLQVILEACHRGHGRPIAPQVVSPLISLEARDLMDNCLSSKEMEIWMSMGDTWRTPLEDWTGPHPQPYKPIFADGFAPYGLAEPLPPVHPQFSSSTLHNNQPTPLHRGESAPPAHYRGRDEVLTGGHHRGRSIDVGGVQLDLDRINFERERIEFEKMMLEKEKKLHEEEKSMRAERMRLDAERKLLHEEAERRSLSSNHHDGKHYNESSGHPSPRPSNGHGPPVQTVSTAPSMPDYLNGPSSVSSPRERAFIEDLIMRNAKVVQVSYDRTNLNAKELSVRRFEFLEVLNDNKNWWECKNMLNRVGYVPHTILTVMSRDFLENFVNGADPYGGQRGSDNSMYRAPSSPSHAPQVSHHQRTHSSQNQRFVVVSEAGVQANGKEKGYADYSRIHTRSPSPPPRIPEPPAPPPISGLNEAIEKMKRQEIANKAARAAEAPKLNVVKRIPKITKQEEALLMEINSTLTRGEGRKILIPKRAEPSVQVGEQSTTKDVGNWLIEKGFSPRTLEILSDMDGAMLFSLSRNKLIEVCGREEGSRVYSQMLVQKKRSAYATKTGQELTAILNYRKVNVDAKNEMPSDEPATLVVRKANGLEERRTAV